MDAINKAAEARAERAAQGVVRDMLKQSGLDDSAIQGMLTEWKSRQSTPEQTIQQLNGEVSARDSEISSLRAQMAALQQGAKPDSVGDVVILA